MNTYTYISPISNKAVTVQTAREFTHIVLTFGLPASKRADKIDYSKEIVDQSFAGSLRKAIARCEETSIIRELTKVA
jgi:hypothetical protein